jgi:hypothetical protein
MPDMDVTIDFDPTSSTFQNVPTVQVPQGTERLHFVRNAHHPGWNFFGIAIWPGSDKPTPAPQPGDVCAPFNTPAPRVQDHGIVVVDTNPGQQNLTYGYMIWVTKPNSSQTYSSDPQIINKGG